jgi:hypothetical protein
MSDGDFLGDEKERLMAKLYPNRAIFSNINRLVVTKLLFNDFHGRSIDLKDKMSQRMLCLSVVDRLPLLDDPIFPKLRPDIRSEEFRKAVILRELHDRITVYSWKALKGDMTVFRHLNRTILPATLEKEDSAALVNLASLL